MLARCRGRQSFLSRLQWQGIFLQYHVLGRDVGQVNVVRSHGSETGEDLGEGRYDVVLQVAARGRKAGE